MKKLFLTSVITLLVVWSFTASNSLSNKININNPLDEDVCGIDCIGLALDVEGDVDLTFDQFEAIINICEAFNLIGCN